MRSVFNYYGYRKNASTLSICIGFLVAVVFLMIPNVAVAYSTTSFASGGATPGWYTDPDSDTGIDPTNASVSGSGDWGEVDTYVETTYGDNSVSASCTSTGTTDTWRMSSSGNSSWTDEWVIDHPVNTGTGTVFTGVRISGNISHTGSIYEDGDISYSMYTDTFNPSTPAWYQLFSILPSPTTFNFVIPGQFDFEYGVPFTMTSELAVYCLISTGTGGNPVPAGSIMGDFSSTASIEYLTLPEGASLQAASGTDYIGATIPTPSAIWLLGSGLIGIVGFRRKFGKA